MGDQFIQRVDRARRHRQGPAAQPRRLAPIHRRDGSETPSFRVVGGAQTFQDPEHEVVDVEPVLGLQVLGAAVGQQPPPSFAVAPGQAQRLRRDALRLEGLSLP